MQTASIIFPHQLFEFSPLFPVNGPVYLVEEFLFFRQYNFHKQKITFHRATMKYYENYLLEKKYSVKYIESIEAESDVRILIAALSGLGNKAITIIDPVDDWLLKRISSSCRKFKLPLKVLETPMFLNTKEKLSRYFKPSKKTFFQTEFYIQERITRKILVDASGNPTGGKWSFDEENRKKYPKRKPVAAYKFPAADIYKQEAYVYTNQHFANNIGSLDDDINYPVGFTESKEWLQQFLKNRLAEFGDYEDAILQKEMLLNHSLLTPMLNVGMLTPAEIVKETLTNGVANHIPVNSLEGFIRQIVGWREFMRAVYITKGAAARTKNYWGFNKKIPQSFYNGSTGILPVDETIKKILKTGYCHHIERLMVLGNFMLLCEFDPDEVYRWFMELFIDAYDWVMVPNVYGMSQFAGGQIMTTKPYISGSNYLLKMSDYPKGDWQQTWDALFWRFLDKQRVFFLKNPRLGMLLKTFDKWDENKKTTIHETANEYLTGLDASIAGE